MSFPRVLGIECVGENVDAGGMDLVPGAQAELELKTGTVFAFEDLVAAHRFMDANQAGGKIVVCGVE